jgi:hypothetical protein
MNQLLTTYFSIQPEAFVRLLEGLSDCSSRTPSAMRAAAPTTVRSAYLSVDE